MFKRAQKTQQLKNLSADQPTKNTQNIFSAVQSNDLEKIRYYINQGIDVNAHDRFGLAPLHYVTSKEALDLLVEKQADVHIESLNIRNISGFVPYTPLSSACFYCKYSLIDPILQYYSLADFKNKPVYVNKGKLLSLIWDSIYQGKKDLEVLFLLKSMQPLGQQMQRCESNEFGTNEIKIEDLLSAIHANDLEKFKRLILQVTNLFAYKVKKDTPLSFAMARYGYHFLTPIFLHSSSDLNKESPDYIKKNKLAISLWQICKQIKLLSQLKSSPAVSIQTSQFYRKKNQFFAERWEKYKQNPSPSAEDLAKVDRLIQDFRL